MARKTYNTDDLITVFDEFGNPQTVFNDFVPTGNQENPGDWSQKTFSLNNVAGDEGVIIKFEFTFFGEIRLMTTYKKLYHKITKNIRWCFYKV